MIFDRLPILVRAMIFAVMMTGGFILVYLFLLAVWAVDMGLCPKSRGTIDSASVFAAQMAFGQAFTGSPRLRSRSLCRVARPTRQTLDRTLAVNQPLSGNRLPCIRPAMQDQGSPVQETTAETVPPRPWWRF